MRYLDDAQFDQVFSGSMPEVEPDSVAVKLLRIAIEAVPREHLQKFIVDRTQGDGVRDIEIRRAEGSLFEHYMVPTTTANVFLVFVWERVERRFMGYHLLDRNAKS